MVKIKITGKQGEIQNLIKSLEKDFTLTEKTDFIKNRGSDYYRKYVEVELKN